MVAYKYDSVETVTGTCPFIEPLQIEANIQDERLRVIWTSASTDSVIKYEVYAHMVVIDSTGFYRNTKRVFLGATFPYNHESDKDRYENRYITEPGSYRIGIRRIYSQGTTHDSTSEIIGMATDTSLTLDRATTNGPLKLNIVLPKEGWIKLTLFNVLGQDLSTIYSGVVQAGVTTKDVNLSPYPAGIYFILLEAGNDQITVRVNYVK